MDVSQLQSRSIGVIPLITAVALKIIGTIIQNYSTDACRRVERMAQLAFGVDPLDAIARLKAELAAIPNVVADPAPEVDIPDVNERGTLLAVRPFCHTDHYWQVFFDTNALIARVFGAAGFPGPFTRHDVTKSEA